MIGQCLTIARLEWAATVRLKWVRIQTAALALLAAAAAYSSGAANDLAGADGFARTTVALVPVVLLLIPLSALILGISGQAADVGTEPFLFGQPIRRTTVLAGRWLGQSAALTATIAAGLGLGGIGVAFATGLDGAARYVFFVVASIILAAIFLAIASAVAAATEKRVVALGVGVFAWCFFVLFFDGAALSLAGWATGRTGGRILLASVFANPVDLIRVATLLVAGTPSVLGAAGDAWVRFLGGNVGAAIWAVMAVTLWLVAPLAIGAKLLNSRDL